MIVTDAIVLCGGAGTRLRPVIGDMPKGLARVNGRPFLDWIIRLLAKKGVTRTILATGNGADAIRSYFDVTQIPGIEVVHSVEPSPMGTAGAVAAAFDHVVGDCALVLNGDSISDFDIPAMARAREASSALLHLWAVPAASGRAKGRLSIDQNGFVLAFNQNAENTGATLINAGVYLMDRDLVASFPMVRPLSLEYDVLPRLAPLTMRALLGSGPVVDIGTPRGFRAAAFAVASWFGPPDYASDDRLIDHVRESLTLAASTHLSTAESCGTQVVMAGRLIAAALSGEHKLLIFGNGGSAADSQHLSAEFVSRLHRDSKRPPLAAIALTTDTSFLTAYANDVGFGGVFERQIEALATEDDVLLGISTSGTSENVLRAFAAGHAIGAKTIALVGMANPPPEADVVIRVPSTSTQRIQEAMLAIEHTLCELVDLLLFGT